MAHILYFDSCYNKACACGCHDAVKKQIDIGYRENAYECMKYAIELCDSDVIRLMVHTMGER